MKKKFVGPFIALSMLVFSSVAEAKSCYTSREFEAEQGLRIHSELMVIGLTCLKSPAGKSVYEKYAIFTRNNQTLISEYEETMLEYYRNNGAKSPERRLHTLRTTLANRISQHSVRMGTYSFCRHFSSRLDRALSMKPVTLRHWAQHVWPNTPTSQPLCTIRAYRKS